jgi:hypothetical protein
MWGTRYIFAWSMDRVAPPQAGELAGERNAPVVAPLIRAYFTTVFGLMLNDVAGFTLVVTGLPQNVVLLLASIAAVIFPWRMRDL